MKYFLSFHFARIPLVLAIFPLSIDSVAAQNWLRIGLGPSQERLRLDSGYNPSGCVGHQCLAAVPLLTCTPRGEDGGLWLATSDLSSWNSSSLLRGFCPSRRVSSAKCRSAL